MTHPHSLSSTSLLAFPPTVERDRTQPREPLLVSRHHSSRPEIRDRREGPGLSTGGALGVGVPSLHPKPRTNHCDNKTTDPYTTPGRCYGATRRHNRKHFTYTFRRRTEKVTPTLVGSPVTYISVNLLRSLLDLFTPRKKTITISSPVPSLSPTKRFWVQRKGSTRPSIRRLRRQPIRTLGPATSVSTSWDPLRQCHPTRVRHEQSLC